MLARSERPSCDGRKTQRRCEAAALGLKLSVNDADDSNDLSALSHQPQSPSPICLTATLASSVPAKGRATRCAVLGLTSNLRTLMPPASAALIRSTSLSAIGGRPSRLPSRFAR
jgi:hypothetical protein